MNLIQTITYDNPPSYMTVGKKVPKKHYISYNAIYDSPHYTIRVAIKNYMKLFLLTKATRIKKMTGEIVIEYIYYRDRRGFDLENKCGIWSKVFCDMLKQKGKIADDSVDNITGVIYRYEPGKERMVINIYQV